MAETKNTLFTTVQHKRGTTAALNAEKNKNLKFAAGELILEDISSGSVAWCASTSSKKYLARIGTGDGFSSAACLWAHAIDVPKWLKVNETPTGMGNEGTIVTLLNSHSQSITDLNAKFGDKGAVATMIANALATLDFTSTDTDATHIVTNVTQVDGKINVSRSAITTDMLNGVGYNDLKAAVGLYSDTADKTTAFGRIAKLENLVSKSSTGLVDKVGALEGKVGDSSAGLVKDVADLKSTVGSGTTGLVGKVANLEEAVGDTTGGLVKDVADLKEADETITKDISDLKAAVGTGAEGLATKVSKNTQDISNLDGRVSDVEVILGKPAEGDTAATGLVKDVADLKNDIGNLTNVMNFRGAVDAKPAVSGYHDGDVIAVTKGVDAGKEFVLSGGEWIEFGNSTATSSAISGLSQDVSDLKGIVGTLESAAATKNTFDSANLNAKAKYLKTEIESVDSKLGDADAAASDASAFARIKRLENTIGLDPESGATQTLETRVAAVERSTSDNAASIKTAETDIDKLENTVGDASKGLVKAVDDLENTVGGASSGLVKAVADLQLTVDGDEDTDGLTKKVATLITDLGNKSGTGTTEADAFSKIRKNAKGISDNAGNIETIMNHLANGWFTKDASGNFVWYSGLTNTNPVAYNIDCGEITE